MIDRLVIIPARGNSKRIKNKNIKNFNGKPIISYSIKNLEKSKLFKKINNKTSLDKMYLGFEIPKYRAVDIDEFEDWKIAEMYHRILKF